MNVPIGTIVAYVLNKRNVPAGWLICDGSLIDPRYQQLINLLGHDHTPNLCGRTLVGAGTGLDAEQSDGKHPNFDPHHQFELNSTGGEYTHTLTEGEMPKHAHKTNQAFTGYKQYTQPGDRIWFITCCDGAATETSGGGEAHCNMQPFYSVYYIIKASD